MDKLADRVFKLIAECGEISRDKLAYDSNFVEDLGYDSLDKVELTMDLEDEFDVGISDQEMDKLHTISDCIKFLKERDV